MLLLPCLFRVRPLVLIKTLSPLPPYYLEVVMVSVVACLAAVMMNS